jgi:hypothetical protein
MYITQALQEMELQGPYEAVPANDSAAWQVKWFVRKLPDGVAVSRNKALADFTAQVIAGASTGITDGRGAIGGSGAGGMGGFALRWRRGAVEVEAFRPMDLAVTLSDLRGRAIAVLAARSFEPGRYLLALPRDARGRPFWLLARDRKTSRLVYRRLLSDG